MLPRRSKASVKAPIALILLAHGSRSRKSLEEMRVLANQLESRAVRVIGAWLSLARPDLAGAVALAAKAGAREVRVLPMFLFTGKHAADDVPALIRDLRVLHPALRLTLLPPLGRHAGLPTLVKRAARLP